MPEEKVINFGDYKPHLSGPVRCLNCKHEWIAIAPMGTFAELECPECGFLKGIYVGLFDVEDGVERFLCNCGCDCFLIMVGQFQCIQCGVRTTFDELAEEDKG
jgi:hypothetical protein